MIKKRPHFAWLIFIACCFIEAGSIGIIINCGGVFLRPVSNELGFKLGDLSIYMTIQGFSLVLSLPFAGKLLPKLNFKLLVTIAGIVCAGMFALMSQFTKPYQWYIGGVVLGLSGGFLFNMPVTVMINNWFHKYRGLAMGVAMAFSGLGGAILSPLASNVIAGVGWRPAYLILGGISAVLVLPWTIFAIRFSPDKYGLKPYGWEEAIKSGNQSGIASPVARVTIKSPRMIMILIISALAGFSYAYTQHISGYAISAGIALAASGVVVSFVMAGNIAGKLILGYIADKMGVKRATVIGLIVIISAFTVLLFGNSVLAFVYIGAALYGLNASLTATMPPLLTRNICGDDNNTYSQLVSYATASVAIMTGIGVMVIGYIYDATKSYTPGFVICIGCCIAAIVMTYILFSRTEVKKRR